MTAIHSHKYCSESIERPDGSAIQTAALTSVYVTRPAYSSKMTTTLRWAFTTMQKIYLLILALSSIPTLAFAEVQCTDRPECWPEGSSMHTGLLLVQQQNAAEKLLASKHEELIKLVSSSSTEKISVDERLLAALKTQQAAWLKYRTEECELVGSLTGAGGTWPSTYANRCEVNHTDQRLRRVRSAIRCIEKIPNEKRFFEQNNCLQQLAPLTNK